MMKKSDCRKWANALWEGKYEKLRKDMSDGSDHEEPTACCCLGVANETFKLRDYQNDRVNAAAYVLAENNIFNSPNPEIFGVVASIINDGSITNKEEIPTTGLSHKEIAILLDFAIESGEYEYI